MELKGYLCSSRFIDDGVTGISMLLADLVDFPLSVWLLVVKLPLLQSAIIISARSSPAKVRWRQRFCRSRWLSLQTRTLRPINFHCLLSRSRNGDEFDLSLRDRLENNRFSASRHRIIHEDYDHFNKKRQIKAAIINRLPRGVTVNKGHGGLGNRCISLEKQEILYCANTRLEIGKIKTVVHEIDPTAFITMHSLSGVEGVSI